MRKAAVWFVPALILLTLVLLIACGGGSKSSSATAQGSVHVTISDPPTCGSAQGGEFAHIWVTIKDVKINQSATASDTDSGWVDLTPTLSSGAPRQVDLLGIADSNCFLKDLGSATEIQPGTYQQIRVLLASSGTAPQEGDACNGAFNCVVLSDNKTVVPLQLSSEAKTGIKIPSGQLAGGSFTVAAGETRDLNIDFNACASIVQQGNGSYRLKPVLHAGEVKLTAQSINGTLVDATTKTAVTGKAVVALEQKDANGVDRVIMQATPNSQGQFVFCPVPAGVYDVIAVVVDDKGVGYAATITTGVQPGNALANVSMFAPAAGTGNVSTAPGTIKGTVSSSTGSAADPVDVVVDVLQQVAIGGANVMVTIPLALQADTSLRVTTAASACPASIANAACADYSVVVPAMNPTAAAFSATGANYVANTATPVNYTIEGAAFTSGDNQSQTCTQAVQTVNKLTDGSSALTATAGATVTAQTMQFTGCQ